jgi:hypothetical protein
VDAFKTIKSERYLKQNGLFIGSRHLSWVVAGMLLAFFLMFWVGYRAGKEEGNYSSEPVSSSTVPTAYNEQGAYVDQVALEQVEHLDEYKVTDGVIYLPSEQFYAQVALYDSRAKAESLVADLKATNIITYIKERSFSNRGGEKQIWYQVVTEHFDNKADLENLVTIVAKQEQLQDICFISC